MRFLAFRHAMRHRSRLSVTLDTKSFFVLLLNTSAQMSDFSPPWYHDYSAKSMSMGQSLHPEIMIGQHCSDMLFPPIYKIDTMDVFSAESNQLPTMMEATGKKLLLNFSALEDPFEGCF